MLSIKNLCKSYSNPGPAFPVLDNLDFEMATSTSVALLGESGSGKSTLLHLIAGLDRPDSGEIHCLGHAIHAISENKLALLRRHNISLVFQQFHLISTLTIKDNIRFQAALCRRYDADFEHTLVQRLGLVDQLDKYPHQLSRGQQQRVAIARALLHKPGLVLADEPTGNLDEQSSLQVMALFSELVEQSGASLLMVTHSPQMASFMNYQVRLHKGKLQETTEV